MGGIRRMWVAEGIVAGIIAGLFMGAASEIGYRTGRLKSHLIIIDGSFALSTFKREPSGASVYVLGCVIHLLTSAAFGLVYAIIARLLDFDTRLTLALALYVTLLWVAMLFTALPIAGQGMVGSRIGGFVWAEQLVLHVVYGIGFWWALGFSY
jgi:hypothetical protein